MAARTILRGVSMLSLEGRRSLRKADVLIERGLIAAIGGVGDTRGALISETSALILPGIVLAHVHLDETLLDRGFVPDADAFRHRLVQLPAWRDGGDGATLEVQARVGVARALSAGASTLCDAGRGRDRSRTLDAAAAYGARLVTSVDFARPKALADLDVLGPLLEQRGLETHVHRALWAGEAERTPLAVLRDAAAAAAERQIPLLVHLGALPGDRGGVRRLERARALGPNTVLCHANGAALRDPGAIDAVAGAGASVVTTPSHDLLLGAPPPPVARLVEAGVNVALGVDGGASRTGFDPFRELRLLLPALEGRIEAPASTALEIATRNGGRALGLKVGTLEVGQRADLVAVDADYLESDSHEAIAELVVRTARPETLRTVWVEGRAVASAGRVVLEAPPSAAREDEVRRRLAEGAAGTRPADRLRRGIEAELRRWTRRGPAWTPGRLAVPDEG